MTFEWDEDKRRANLRKHGVQFADAVTAFDDGNAILALGYTWREERIA